MATASPNFTVTATTFAGAHWHRRQAQPTASRGVIMRPWPARESFVRMLPPDSSDLLQER